jgi:DNA polymerase I-like protein with 3'-5' exonuclease and polymerase domains
MIYGMHGNTLRIYAETGYGVKLSPEEAEAAREAFFRTYPAVAAWHARQEKKMFESGFEVFWRHDFHQGFYQEKRPCARTLSGRLRVWPVIERERRSGSGTYLRKAGANTEMFNTPDQGTGADMIKCAMARLYRELARRGWEEVRLVATVHDELVLEAPEELAERAADLLGSVMEYTAARFLPDVPVEVEAAVCETWAEK